MGTAQKKERKRISVKQFEDKDLLYYAQTKYPIGNKLGVEIVGRLGNLSPIWLTRQCAVYKRPLHERANEHLKRYSTFDNVRFLRWAKSANLPPTSLSIPVLNDLSLCETNYDKFAAYHKERLIAKIKRVRDRLPDYQELLAYSLPPKLMEECQIYKGLHPDFDLNYFDYFYSILPSYDKDNSLMTLLWQQRRWMIDNAVDLMA